MIGATVLTSDGKLQALVYNILPSRRKVPESGAARSVIRSVCQPLMSLRTWALSSGIPGGEIVMAMGEWKSVCYLVCLDQIPKQRLATVANYLTIPTLRASLSGTFLQGRIYRKPVLGVCTIPTSIWLPKLVWVQ